MPDPCGWRLQADTLTTKVMTEFQRSHAEFRAAVILTGIAGMRCSSCGWSDGGEVLRSRRYLNQDENCMALRIQRVEQEKPGRWGCRQSGPVANRKGDIVNEQDRMFIQQAI